MPYYAVSQLFTGTDIFIIPTFQRPYSWEEPQWDDLLRDVRVGTTRLANNPNALHYFGPIHTIRVAPNSPLLDQFIDSNNTDIGLLRTHNFQANGAAYNVHLVVDGQQRMVTLFALLECCANSPLRYVDLPNAQRIPKLILNPATDHAHWRFELHMPNTVQPNFDTRSQRRLNRMFALFGPAPFPQGGNEYTFLIGQSSQLMWIELPPGATLAPFLTLNDRGKDLTKLEKVKSLAMEADENGNYGLATQLQTSFGNVYRSIDLEESLLDEDNFLRQLAITLWEKITGTPIGNNPNNTYPRVHDESLENIYQRYRTQLSVQAAPPILQALVSEVVSNGDRLANEHQALSAQVADSFSGVALNQPSFVNAIFPLAPPRDAAHDYLMILKSLGLQPKQLAILLAVRDRYHIDWHAPLGQMHVSNRLIKQTLITEYGAFSANVPDNAQWKFTILNEINAIPEESDRVVTPLHLAELLRLIVGNSKPGTFTYKWQYGFGAQPVAAGDFLNSWIDYLLTFSSRDIFVIEQIARNLQWDNQSRELRYLLREFECCLPGGLNTHGSIDFEIEHFFGRDFMAIQAVAGNIFVDKGDYDRNFVDRPGNKLILKAGDNEALNMTSVVDKVQAYNNPAFTKSAQQIAGDLTGFNNIGLLSDYVKLRQLRLAAFAAKRF